MIGYRRGPQPVIQGVLAKRALSPVDRRKHGVEIEVVPRPVIERARRGRPRQPAAMRGGHRVHAPGAVDGLSPGGTNAGEPPLPGEPERGNREQRRECRCDQPCQEHVSSL
jgi:hypothetical protein